MEFNKEGFIQDALKEFIRVNKLKGEAYYSGKRSKAQINFCKFASKYNLSNKGYGFLDSFFGGVIMKTMFKGYTIDKNIILPAIIESLEENDGHLDKELIEFKKVEIEESNKEQRFIQCTLFN